MALTAGELVQKSIELRKEKRFEEALAASLAATAADAKNADGWWQTALNRISLNDYKSAISSLNKTIDLAPEFSGGYIRLAEILIEQNTDMNEAKSLLKSALKISPDSESAIKSLIRILHKEDIKEQDNDEIMLLERLRDMESDIDFNRLGVLYWRNDRVLSALETWKEGLTYYDQQEMMFNLGLAYQNQLINQPLDAIDIWRITEAKYPNYDVVGKSLTPLLNRTKEYEPQILKEGMDTLESSQWYSIYVNPIALLGFGKSQNCISVNHEPKEIIKLKKRLLTEIELEDGAISWIPSLVIDRARAITLCDEILDQSSWQKHLNIYNNRALMNFLHTGNIEHFTLSRDDHSDKTLDLLRDDPEFTHWLSQYFSEQFNIVAQKLISTNKLACIRALFSGRNWSTHEGIELSLTNSRRVLETKINLIEDFYARSQKRMGSLSELKSILERTKLIEIINEIPIQLQDIQNKTSNTLRKISILAVNNYDESELGKSILNIISDIKIKSDAVTKQIADDIKTIDNILKEEEKYEVKLVSNNVAWQITKNGIAHGEIFVNKEHITSVRWGMNSLDNGRSRDYLIAFTGKENREHKFNWTASKNLDQNDEFFMNYVRASIAYIVPTLCGKISDKLNAGETVIIDDILLTKTDIRIRVKKWFSTSEVIVKWANLEADISQGCVWLYDKLNSKTKFSLSIRDIPNAVLFEFLIDLQRSAH